MHKKYLLAISLLFINRGFAAESWSGWFIRTASNIITFGEAQRTLNHLLDVALCTEDQATVAPLLRQGASPAGFGASALTPERLAIFAGQSNDIDFAKLALQHDSVKLNAYQMFNFTNLKDEESKLSLFLMEKYITLTNKDHFLFLLRRVAPSNNVALMNVLLQRSMILSEDVRSEAIETVLKQGYAEKITHLLEDQLSIMPPK
jgi:hypothetical protein